MPTACQCVFEPTHSIQRQTVDSAEGRDALHQHHILLDGYYMRPPHGLQFVVYRETLETARATALYT